MEVCYQTQLNSDVYKNAFFSLEWNDFFSPDLYRSLYDDIILIKIFLSFWFLVFVIMSNTID